MAKHLVISKSPKAIEALADQYKALGDQTRLKLMMAVIASGDAEACVCDLTPATGLAQSTVSHHLKILVEAKLLNREQRGKWSYYSLTETAQKLLK